MDILSQLLVSSWMEYTTKRNKTTSNLINYVYLGNPSNSPFKVHESFTID